MPQTDKILMRAMFVLVLVLVASQLYFFFALHRLQTAGMAGVVSPPLGIPSAATSTAAGITAIGPNDRVGYEGTIAALQGNAMQVKTSEKTVTFKLSPNTRYFMPTTRKSNAEFSQELAAYNAQVVELLKDPQKNAVALKTIELPSQFNNKTLTLADLALGSYVYVTPGAQNSDGSYAALKVAVVNTTATTTAQ